MSGSSTEDSWRYPGWKVAAASAAGVFVSFSSLLVFTFGIFLKPVAEEFGWSREAVSLAFGVAALSVAACSPGLGWLLDRFGPKRVILPCMAVFGCTFASLSLLGPRIWQLYATFLVFGMVGNGTAQLAYSRAVSSWFVRRRGFALAVLMTGSAVGAMIWPAVAQALIGRFGWRGASVLLGAIVLGFGLPVVASFVRESPRTRHGVRLPVTGSSVVEGLRSRPFWILIAVLFLTSLGQNGAIIHLSSLLTDRGVSARGGALALSAMGGAAVLGRLLAGRLLDLYFAPRVAFCLLGLAALGAFILSSAHSLIAGAVAASLIGVGMGGEAGITPYLLSRYFGLRSFSALYGLTWTAYAIAGAIGPVLMGRAFDATGSYTLFLTWLAALMLLAASLMLFLPAYRDEPREAQ